MASLYLVRHAIAADRGDEYPDDTERPLTRKGRSRMRLVVAGLRALDPAIEVVLTSPLARALQTAELLIAGLKGAPTLAVCPVLAPGHTPALVAEALGAHGEAASVALVGHEPDLGVLAAWLIGAREPLTFRKGGVARIDTATLPPSRNGRLIWLATPGMLRALA